MIFLKNYLKTPRKEAKVESLVVQITVNGQTYTTKIDEGTSGYRQLMCAIKNEKDPAAALAFLVNIGVKYLDPLSDTKGEIARYLG